MLKDDKERIQSLVTETLTLLCKNGLSYNEHFTINAVIGVTLDSDKEFHFVVSETVVNTKERCNERPSQDVSESDDCNGQSDLANVSSFDEQKNADKTRAISSETDASNVRIKSEPNWERSAESEIGDLSLDSSHLEQWCIIDNKESLKTNHLDYLSAAVGSVTCDPIQQLADVSYSKQKPDVGMSWQQFNSPQLYQMTNQSCLTSPSYNKGFRWSPGESVPRPGRKKEPITDQRVARKIIQCKGRVITVSQVQHFFSFGKRPSFNKIKEIMSCLERQGFGVMQIVELENKRTKIKHKAAKAMAFVKRPVEEVLPLLPAYDVSPVDYERLYHR